MRIKDVAREAGVSTATVSHVINNTRYVTDVTRARVMRAVERCDYYPNAQARSLALGRSYTLGLLVSDISNPFFPELVKSIETAAFERGYDVLLTNTNYDANRTRNYVRRFIERKVAGVALMTSELDPALVDELARQKVSVVFLDQKFVGAGVSNLSIDYAAGIDEAVRHLISLGHQRIAYIGGPAHLLSATKRLTAFQESMLRHLSNEASQPIYEADFRIEGGQRAAREMLGARGQRATAVVVANDMMALGVMRECRAANLSLPRDLSIVGFDDIAFASLSDPPLTTVRLPQIELGRKVVESLLQTIEQPERAGIENLIATHLVVRGTTAPPPEEAGYEAD